MADHNKKSFLNLEAIRREGSTAAVFFVHGFTGTAVETWGKFPELLRGDAKLAGYDFFFWGYFSRKPGGIPGLNWLIKRFWKDDPTISSLGESLRTPLENTKDLHDHDFVARRVGPSDPASFRRRCGEKEILHRANLSGRGRGVRVGLH